MASFRLSARYSAMFLKFLWRIMQSIALFRDYVYTLVISEDEDEKLLANGKKFVEEMVRHLKEKNSHCFEF